MEEHTLPQEAQMITLHKYDNARQIMIVGSNEGTYNPGPFQTKSHVRIIPASDNLLKKELENLSISVGDVISTEIVSKKFHRELASIKGGRLAYYDSKKHQSF